MMTFCIRTERCYAECHLSFILSVKNKPFKRSVLMLSVVVLLGLNLFDYAED
jgi:hypothetical protein